MRKVIVAMIFLSVFAVSVHADVPKTINYQGRLRTTTNQAVPDGQYMITFRLYDADTGGTKVWEESQLINTKQGYFNTTLGNINAFSSSMLNQPLWLGLKVGSEAEMTPRMAMSSSAQAINVADGTITTSKIADGAVTLDKLSSNVLTTAIPIGTIMAWHKSMTGTPALPEQWAECNGQTLNDPASPYNGQVIPNLNGEPSGANSPDFSSKERLFLRGGIVSGTGQQDAFQGHTHTLNNELRYIDTGGSYQWPGAGTDAKGGDLNPAGTPPYVAQGSNGTPRPDNETRPKSMSVIWIMRIK